MGTIERMPRESATETSDVLIIGAGICGLGTAIQLRAAGIRDVTLLEKATEVGGTWRDNTYPGVGCDVPSDLYSLSFAPNPEWSRTYSRAEEIQSYIVRLTDRHGLRDRIRFGREVVALRFDEQYGEWHVRCANEECYRARALVVASGPLAGPSYPDIPGLEQYQGAKIHSADWNHDYDFRGKRVAVVGTGASAIQIVPELVREVSHLKVFQRTPPWVMPKPDFATGALQRALYRRLPASQRTVRNALAVFHELMAFGVVFNTPFSRLLERQARRHLHRQVADPQLRRRLTPDYCIGCKRILVSNDYYPALQRDNCELVTTPLVGMRAGGIVTADGLEHHFDAIVFATGYAVNKEHWPLPVHGRSGRTLDSAFTPHAQAYKSTVIHGFPNLFTIPGPNGGPGHQSFLVYAEAQMRYTVQGIREILRRPGRFLDVRRPVQEAYNRRIQARMKYTTWNSGCQSWYLNSDGHNATMFPGLSLEFIRNLHRFRLQDYEVVHTEPRPDRPRRGGLRTIRNIIRQWGPLQTA